MLLSACLPDEVLHVVDQRLEKLPPAWQRVLFVARLYSGPRICFGHWTSGRNVWMAESEYDRDGNHLRTGTTTYWMPLPEPADPAWMSVSDKLPDPGTLFHSWQCSKAAHNSVLDFVPVMELAGKIKRITTGPASIGTFTRPLIGCRCLNLPRTWLYDPHCKWYT